MPSLPVVQGAGGSCRTAFQGRPRTDLPFRRRPWEVVLVLRQSLALAAIVLFGGCDAEQSSSLPPAPIQWDEEVHDRAAHTDPTRGPHDGQLFEVGNGAYHAELVHDDSSHRISIYLLDAQANGSVQVPELELTINLLIGGKPTQFRLAAAPLDGESPQHPSRFELTDEKLCAGLGSTGQPAAFQRHHPGETLRRGNRETRPRARPSRTQVLGQRPSINFQPHFDAATRTTSTGPQGS